MLHWMPQIKDGLTSFSVDTSKRSDILLFNMENHRDNHWIVLIFSEFLWAQSQTVLLSAEACLLLFCLRPVGSAQRGNMHRPRAELYHSRHVYSERTRGRRRVFRAQQHKQDQRHMSRFLQRSFALLIPFQQQPDTVGPERPHRSDRPFPTSDLCWSSSHPDNLIQSSRLAEMIISQINTFNPYSDFNLQFAQKWNAKITTLK